MLDAAEEKVSELEENIQTKSWGNKRMQSSAFFL